MVVRSSPVSRIKAHAEGGFDGGSDDTTTNALWNALTERNENENVMGRRIQLPPKNFANNNNNNKKSFDEKKTKKKTKEREAKKDGLSLRSMAVVPVVRFGVVEITTSAEERVKIVNDTNRNWKICEYRFEGEEDKSEYELFGFAGGVLPKIVKRDEEMTVSIKWTPKVVSKKATAVGALKLVCKTCATEVFDEGEAKTFTVRLRGVTVVKKEEGTTEKPRKQERDKMEAMIDEGDSEEEDAFGANKENVIEDDAFDEAYEGFKGLPSAYAASASWRRQSNQENLAKHVAASKAVEQHAKELEREEQEEPLTMASLRLLNSKNASSTKPTKEIKGEVKATSSSVTSDGFESAREFASQQEAEFVSWLNRTISPRDTSEVAASTSHSVKMKSEQMRAREFRDARAASRRVMAHLYTQDAEVGVIMREVEYRIESKLIRLKSDGGIFLRDLRMKQDFIKTLSSVNTFWLKLGVDAVLGDTMRWQPQNPRECAKECSEKLFRSHEMEIKYGLGDEFPGQPPFAEGYENALNDVVLERILMLVLLLDRAQNHKAHPKAPKLFNLNASIKSTRELAQKLLTASCYGEGDILRNLKKAGFIVPYEQTAASEYDFTVTNLASDLRDGIRLCKLIEMLAPDVTFASIDKKTQKVVEHHSLLSECAFPVKTREDKLNNVRVALNAAKDVLGVALPGAWSKITPSDIVDGHREATCGILWAMMTHEHTKNMSRNSLAAPKNMLTKEICKFPNAKIPTSTIQALEREMRNNKGALASRPNGMPRCSLEALLLTWAKACCSELSLSSSYSIKCSNLGSDFADGRVLLAILRKYAPGLTGSRRLSRENLELNHPIDMDERKRAREIAARNFLQVAECLKAIGGVPIPGFDVRFHTSASALPSSGNSSGSFNLEKDIPVPQTGDVATYLLCLCSRVIQHVERVDSAKKIQRWWRLKRPNRPKVADVARMWSRAQTVISKHLRGYFARKEYERSLDAVVTFQKMCRGRADRKMLQKRHNAAIVIEKHARGFVAKKGYKRLRENVIRMQSFYRAKRAALEANVKYNFAMVIQASARGWQVRRAVRVQKKAILDIQKCYRGYLGRKSVEEMKEAKRKEVERVEMEKREEEEKQERLIEEERQLEALVLDTSATLIQSRFRAFQLRKEFVLKRAYTENMQHIYRIHRERRALRKANRERRMLREIEEKNRVEEERVKAAITIQCYYRMYFAKELLKFRKYRRDKNAAIKLVKFQARVRGVLARKAFKEASKENNRKCHLAAIRMQRHIRGFLYRQHHLRKHIERTMNTLFKSSRSCGRKDVKTLAGNYAKIAEVCQSKLFGYLAIEACYLRCPDSVTILVETLQMCRDYESESDLENPFLLACDILHTICSYENAKFCESIMRSHQYARDVARCRKIKDTTMYLSLTNENRANVLTSAIKKKNVVVGNDEDEVNDEDAMILNELRASAEQCKKHAERLNGVLECLRDAQPSIWKYAQTPKKKRRSVWDSHQHQQQATLPQTSSPQKASPQKKPISIGHVMKSPTSKKKIVSIASPPVRHSPRLLELKEKKKMA
jgi:hypothetical protein